ncbi:oxygenase MpaB family protein [Oligoflexus tunisiensis]|uniref:oxygenase MpaB family protein n=1 Tax=Oligoflexus tunisiensis TaxID=708132 RepID=UPI000B182418|nr:oxygenase MpaB family protein [Oligoflexus tunisiensis]
MREPAYFKLDPAKDYEAIIRCMAVETWTFDVLRGTEIALLKTFAIPEIAKILVESGEFLNRPQKRYDDTDLLISLFVENGPSSVAGRQAIRRINRMHARYPITNEQMLYVLSTFVVDPMLWIENYGHRPLNALEKEASFQFWIHVGRLMAIKDLFPNLETMVAFHEDYEREHMVYSEYNAQLYHLVLPTMARMMPAGLGRLVTELLPSLMPPRMCAAFGVKSPGPLIRTAVQAILRARAQAARFLPQKPVYRTRMKRTTYPNGFTQEELGV